MLKPLLFAFALGMSGFGLALALDLVTCEIRHRNNFEIYSK